MALTLTHNETPFSVGDSVRVHQRIKESGPKGDRFRIQFFEGLVIATKGEGPSKTFTVRRIGANGIGVERIFPVASPLIEKVDVMARGVVRRAKLYYLRDKSPKEVAEVTKRFSKLRAAQAASVQKSAKKKVAKASKKKVSKKATSKKTS